MYTFTRIQAAPLVVIASSLLHVSTFTSLHFRLFHHRAEPLQISGNRLRQFDQQTEHLLRGLKPNLQAALANPDSLRQLGEVAEPRPLGNLELHASRPELRSGGARILIEPPPPAGLVAETLPAGNRTQLRLELGLADQERFPELITAKPVHQTNGIPPVHAQQHLQPRPVHNRGAVTFKTPQSVANLMQPFGFTRHDSSIPQYTSYCHSCAISEDALALSR